LVKHRSALKNRIHASLMTFGHPCAVSDLFGLGGRELLERLQFPEPRRGDIEASLRLIDELGEEIDAITDALRAGGADHRYVPLLMTLPGVSWILAYTIAAEIGDMRRFQSPTKLVGYSGLCPRVPKLRSWDPGPQPAAPGLRSSRPWVWSEAQFSIAVVNRQDQVNGRVNGRIAPVAQVKKRPSSGQDPCGACRSERLSGASSYPAFWGQCDPMWRAACVLR
jgi:transposase